MDIIEPMSALENYDVIDVRSLSDDEILEMAKEIAKAANEIVDKSPIERLKMDIGFLLYEVYWLEIILLLSFFIIGFILDQKFGIQKPRKWFLACNALIKQRFLSALSFYVPYLDILNTLIPQIQVKHPFFVRLLMPNFIVDSMAFIQQIPFLSFVYLAIVYGCFVRYRRPKDRFIRFNVMYSVLIMSFIGIFQELYYNALDTILKEDLTAQAEVSLVLYVLWVVIVFYPCFSDAITGKYTSNYFMRENIELHLGRDDEDFIWWDRRGKDYKPKGPKK